MDEKTKREFINLFNEGFEEIVRPEIEYLREGMEGRFDKVDNRLDNVESRLGNVEHRLEAVDRKVDRIAAKQLDQESELKEHGKRLKKVEYTARAA